MMADRVIRVSVMTFAAARGLRVSVPVLLVCILAALPAPAAIIAGTVWKDADRSGTRDAGEPGLAGATIYHDANLNGRYDAGEPTAMTNADGAYAFTGLAAGRYFLASLPQARVLPTAPREPALVPPVFIITRGGPRVFSCDDLNNDGYLDIVTSNNFERSVSVAISGAGGTYGPATHYEVGASPRFVLVEDFNHDGWRDLAVTNQHGDSVSVLMNNGDGTFAPQVTYPCDDETFMIAKGDLNEDGDVDLAVINQFGNNLTILLGNGDGTFYTSETIWLGYWPHDVVVQDIDQDGHLDIATANFLVRSVALLWGHGDGTFEPNQYLAVGDRPLHTRIADLDKDGALDLVVENRFSNNVMVMYGNGDRTFTDPAVYPSGEQTHDAALVDVNLDSWLDIVVVGYMSNDVTIYLNTGQRDFSLKGIYPVGGVAPLFAMPLDLDQDGDPDLVVNNYESDDVTTLINDGAGAFSPGPSYPIGQDPRSMVLADLDNNGHTDIVTAAMFDYRVGIIYNAFGRRIVPVGASSVVGGADFGAYESSAQGEPAGGGNRFKLRIGEGSHKNVARVAAAQVSTWPLKLFRTSGAESRHVSLDAVVVDGDPALWDVQLAERAVLLGPAPTVSRADANEPGVLKNRPGDGAVDDADLAILESCFTGPGQFVPPESFETCLQLDLDGDLDIDDNDRDALLADWTGPVITPWARQVELRVTPRAGAPAGSSVRVQILATDTDSGETHSVFAYVTRNFYDPGISPIQRVDWTVERSSKVILARKQRFDLVVYNRGAAADTIEVSVDPVSGFAFEIRDAITLQPRTTYAMAAAPDGATFPESVSPFYIEVTAPANWPFGSTATFRVNARSVNGGMTNGIDLEVVKGGPLWAPSDLRLEEGRRHNVQPGADASFGFQLVNPLPTQRTLTLTAVALPPADVDEDGDVDGDDLSAFAACMDGPDLDAACQPDALSRLDLDGDGDVDVADFATLSSAQPIGTMTFAATQFTLAPGAQAEATARVSIPAGAPLGLRQDWQILLGDGANLLATALVGVKVTDAPKVIYVSMDGLAPGYLTLNAAGTGPGSPGDWLMPNVQAFLSRATHFSGALSDLPSATDHNQTGALTGSHMGVNGIGSLVSHYYGRDNDGVSVIKVPSPSLLRHGPKGAEVLSLFDVAHASNPDSYSVHLSGKWWVDNYVVGDKPSGGGDIAVDSEGWPQYVPDPEPHVIGDPPTDPDAETDPPLPPWIPNWGTTPGLFPADRWIMEGALKVLSYQDPDVMFVLMAGPDDAGHMMGAAWDPSLWDDRGTPEMGDDVNLVNPRCAREGVLDEVRETDALFGELLDQLENRGIADSTYVVLMSDHGMISCSPHRADVAKLLESRGFSHRDDFVANAGGPMAFIFEVAPERLAEFEDVLENSPSIYPGYDTNPWLVLNRQEMLTGVDVHTGIRVGDPGEMYSEYLIEHDDGTNDMADWPDFIMLFFDEAQIRPMHFEPVLGEEDDLNGEAFQGGHGFFATQPCVLALSGPRVPAGQIVPDPVRLPDIAPTLYRLLGWTAPPSVQGQPLPGIEYEAP
ncbi:MAG: VCBS repeat-containing protein [Phycisphaerae bacterium]|jgi:predicted AlkP superfamily pyrophosphatase or phosphodiesterase